jgi:hypothetical protein
MTPSSHQVRIRSDLTPSDRALLRLDRWAEAGICVHLATMVEGATPPVYLVELPGAGQEAGARYVAVGQRQLLTMSDHPQDAAEALAELAKQQAATP